MTFEKMEDIAVSLLLGAITAIGGLLVWAFRRILTNQAEIELMRAEGVHRDQMRAEDREHLRDLTERVMDLQNHQSEIKHLLERMIGK